jgi:hypothetical protein
MAVLAWQYQIFRKTSGKLTGAAQEHQVPAGVGSPGVTLIAFPAGNSRIY